MNSRAKAQTREVTRVGYGYVGRKDEDPHLQPQCSWMVSGQDGLYPVLRATVSFLVWVRLEMGNG